MIISGLENDYYLAGNDIWISVSQFAKVPVKLELQVLNNNTGKTTSIFRIYPDISNIFEFNVAQLIRPLQPNPNISDNNSLQSYNLIFTIFYEDDTTDGETVTKYFIRGGRDKNNVDEWYLQNGQKLVIAKWTDWGIDLPGYAQKIQNQLIVDYVPLPSEIVKIPLRTCNFKIIKFLNSLGGYQFWVFESFEIENKAKALDEVSAISRNLRVNPYRATGSEVSKEINLMTKTPIDLQPIILDLIGSADIQMYDSNGVDSDSKWTSLIISGTASAVLNTIDAVYTNEIKFKLPTFNRLL